MVKQTVLPFKLEKTNEIMTSHAGLARRGILPRNRAEDITEQATTTATGTSWIQGVGDD